MLNILIWQPDCLDSLKNVVVTSDLVITLSTSVTFPHITLQKLYLLFDTLHHTVFSMSIFAFFSLNVIPPQHKNMNHNSFYLQCKPLPKAPCPVKTSSLTSLYDTYTIVQCHLAI